MKKDIRGRLVTPPTDAFDVAMQMLLTRCRACNARGWYLGFRGRARCGMCRGTGRTA